jgi:uncharacterized iron-regulated membrane protein
MSAGDILLWLGSIAGAGSIGLLRHVWGRAQRSLALSGAAWGLLVVGLVLGAWAAGAWGIAIVSIVATLAAFVLLALAGLAARPARVTASNRRANMLPERGEPLRIGGRLLTFLLTVPLAFAVSVLIGLAARFLADRAGMHEANSNVLMLILMPLVWTLLATMLLIWPRMSRAVAGSLVQRALSAHAAIGLIAGALLYIVLLTGTLSVFYEEWQRLEQPDAPEMAAVSPQAVQAAVANVLASEKGKTPTTHLYVHLPSEALPRTTVTTDHQAVHVDARGRVAGPEENAWSEFLLGLHYTLNLPSIVGISIVGVLGVMMMALSVTGVVAHPRIFRDAFRLRARDKGGVGIADWHNRLGVWTLPFGIAIALTGAMIGLATLSAYGMAASFYKGDIEATYAPIFGGEGKPDPAPGRLPDVVAALDEMARRFPEAKPYYVVLHDPGTKGQHVQIIASHERRLIYGDNYNFDADGRYHGHAGLSDGQIGQQLAASTYNLHFGNFGGLPVKLAYFLFGLAVTVVGATGTSIWLGKRARRGHDEPRLRAAWQAVVWGTPVALCGTFLMRLLLGNGVPMAAAFWVQSALILVAAVLLARQAPVRFWLQSALAALLAGSGIVAALHA